MTSAIASGFFGCEAPADTAMVTVSDSAGTRIVTYTSLEDEAFPVIALEPRVDTIGAAEGAEEYFFRRIVMDVERILIHHLAELPSNRIGSGTSACR